MNRSSQARLTYLCSRSPILVIAALVLGVSQAFAHGPTKPNTDPYLVVRDVLMANATAFETGDLHALEEIWANDQDVTVFESGHANYGWEDYRDHHLKPEIEELKNVQYNIFDIKPKVAGKTAWATFKYTIAADLQDRHVDATGLGTAVLEWRKRAWRIIHWHTSSPREPAAAAAKP